jgi:hypothetical protein
VLVLLLLIEFDRSQIEHEHDYEVAPTQPFATFPARERRLRRVDLLTWSCKAGPNQRMRSRRSLRKKNNSLKEGVPLRRG